MTGALRHRVARHGHGLDLEDQRRPGTLDALDEGCRIAERQHHCRGLTTSAAKSCHERRLTGPGGVPDVENIATLVIKIVHHVKEPEDTLKP